MFKEQSLDTDINTELAVEKAKKCDVIVVCLSEDPAAEGPADINSLDFDAQQQLVHELSQIGLPIILITTTSRPRLMREIEPLSEAILLGYLPSNEGGTALAQTIFGENNPSGKTPPPTPNTKDY